MPTPVATVLPTTEAERLWREITGHLREACILRRQGRHQASTEILEHTLPPLIRFWAAESALPSDEAKARLNQLFTEEQARIESHWIIARFLTDDRAAASAARQLAAFPAVTASPSPAAMWFPSIAPRRIPVDDVVNMIDSARDLERSTVHSPSL